MSELTIEVTPRDKTNKNANRRLRAGGEVPAVVYGGGRDPVAIQVGQRKVADLLRYTSDNAIFLLELAGTGKSRHAMIRDLQTDPITGEMLHIDFQRILMDEEIRVSVQVEVLGTPLGVRRDGGILDFILREVEITCLPGDIPESFEIDISELEIGDNVTVGDLEIPKGVTLLEDTERVIASVVYQQVEEVEEEEEDEILLEAEAAEPEVIGRGKEEGEEEEPEA